MIFIVYLYNIIFIRMTRQYPERYIAPEMDVIDIAVECGTLLSGTGSSTIDPVAETEYEDIL